MEIRVIPTAIPEVVMIETAFVEDERGFFIETYHRQQYADHGLAADMVQDNHSRSQRGVLRGIHYQGPPVPMVKLVRCTFGVLLDVAVDLRVGSPTFGKAVAVELSAENKRQLWVPVGFGHGFVALSEFAEIQYKCSAYYTPSAEGAVAWNDPDLAIAWPIADPILSRRDQAAMSLREYLARPVFHYEQGA
jgi:dTDP-4-dehydrorhamnose 3,5-epimerase